MKIVYCGLKNENYNPKRGTSFEYNNFYLTLKNLPGIEVIDYFFDQIKQLGKKRFNEQLLQLIEKEKPDLIFVFMYTDEIDVRTFKSLKFSAEGGSASGGKSLKFQSLNFKTLAWFSDDHWRLYNYSRFYAPHFDWVVTTYSKAPEIYSRYGIHNVIKSQWACNNFVWQPIRLSGHPGIQSPKRDIDVSFVGQWNPARGRIINFLRKNGINVFTRGYRWPEGKATQQEMIEILSRSKINLNLNASVPMFSLKRLARIFLKNSNGKIVPDWHLISNIKSWWRMSVPQIKARPFEILGCRTFLISPRADDMDNYYEDGKEVIYYDNNDDLLGKIKYWLSRDEEREKLAQAGYKRTLREHTYEMRFREVFKIITQSVKLSGKI